MKKIKSIALLTSLGVLLVIVGLGLLVSAVRSQETNLIVTPSRVPTVASAPATQVGYVGGVPLTLSIPTLHIDLPVVPGTYNARTKTWTLTLDKVQYATMTPQPNNQGGNTFLYGHYRANVFASLHRIQSSAQAIINTDNGHTFYYQLADVRVVNPDDSNSVFAYSGKPMLTIQTCTGLFFQDRQLFIFDLVKVA